MHCKQPSHEHGAWMSGCVDHKAYILLPIEKLGLVKRQNNLCGMPSSLQRFAKQFENLACCAQLNVATTHLKSFVINDATNQFHMTQPS